MLTASRVQRRADAVALQLGAKLTVSAIFLACIATIAIGAAALLDTMRAMDADLKVMSQELDTSNEGLVVLNKTMDSLPPTDRHMVKIIKTVTSTRKEVRTSSRAVAALNSNTKNLNAMIADIAGSTGRMNTSLGNVDGETRKLGTVVESLSGDIGPLAATNKKMLTDVHSMRRGMQGMNASLAYVVRTLNYIAAPPHGQGFLIRTELDKKALPPIPGVHAKTDPVQVFPRNPWPVYKGP